MYDFRNAADVLPSYDAPSQVLLGGAPSLPDSRRWFVDLRAREDDRTVLKNPHKGWFWHYIDNGMLRPMYREEHDIAGDGLEDFPGLNHLYLRFDWGDVEKTEGDYDFSYLDETMELWCARGFTFQLRVCTYEASPKIPFATPRFVYEAGARCFRLPGGNLQPDYADPVYLEKLENFMRVFGARYNHDPRVELVDIGTFGTWGEGHTAGGGDRLIYPVEVMLKHMALSARCFPDKTLIMNDDVIASRFGCPDEDRQLLLDYARARGFGLQDDSICVQIYKTGRYDFLRTYWAFDALYPAAPSVIEFDHYHAVLTDPDLLRGGLSALEAVRRAHATYAGFHGYPREWLARERYLTEYLANRLGYWFFLTGADVPPMPAGAVSLIRLHIDNRGYAPAYHRYQLRLRLVGAEGVAYEQALDADPRLWQPGQTSVVTAGVRPRGVKPGRYEVQVGLFEGGCGEAHGGNCGAGRPVRFAMREEFVEDGYCKVCETEVLE